MPDLKAELMRPTVLPLNKNRDKIIFVGGTQEGSIFLLDGPKNEMKEIQPLPKNHNPVANLIVNWKNKCLFSFITNYNDTILKSFRFDIEKGKLEDNVFEEIW